MFGHGSPSLRPVRSARLGSGTVFWKHLLAAVIAVCAMLCCAPLAADDNLRLRIVWGGETARQWRGTIRVTEGAFANHVCLGREADDPAALDVEGAVIRVDQRRPTTFNGFDVLVLAPADAKLVVELAPRDRPSAVRRVEVSLADLVTKPHGADLDEHKSQVFIERAPGDRVRVEFERDTLVFSPGETFEFRITPHRLDLDVDTALRCKVQLFKARDRKSVV